MTALKVTLPDRTYFTPIAERGDNQRPVAPSEAGRKHLLPGCSACRLFVEYLAAAISDFTPVEMEFQRLRSRSRSCPRYTSPWSE